jgi:hypothetical protein
MTGQAVLVAIVAERAGGEIYIFYPLPDGAIEFTGE